MKTITVPRSQSHVRTWGAVFCVICQHLCERGERCDCCKPLAALSRRHAPPVTGTGIAVWIVAVIAIIAFGRGWYLAGEKLRQFRHDRDARKAVRKFHKSPR